jgi:hypothetical protein
MAGYSSTNGVSPRHGANSNNNNNNNSNGNNMAVAEREAELVALQSAFDEYIASSRELEEELDAELAKMRTCVLSMRALAYR